MTELNLPFVRFVKQVSNGMSRTKYSYLAMQDDLLSDLQKASWKMATCSNNNVTTVPNKVSQTDGKYDEDGTQSKPPTYTAFIDDKYDAYKQGGDANTSTATFCGYAGMVAYRFSLPTSYSSNITNVKLKFQASRYLRSGLKVVVVLNNTADPSNDWNVVRGIATSTTGQKIVSTPSDESEIDSVKSWGFLSQDVPTLIDSRASEATLDMDASESRYADLGTSTRFQYMWVYVSLEDYTDYWTYYDASTPRYYSIEGSATLVASVSKVVFAGTETATVPTNTMEIVKGGVLPKVFVDDSGSQAHFVTVQRNGDPLNDGNLQMIVTEIEKNGGIINRVDVLPPIGSAYNQYGGMVQFACICGKGFKGTFPNLDGLLFYDCERRRLIGKSSFSLPMTQISINALNEETYHYGIVRCLMGYDNGKGFYFLPCVGNHVPENRITEEYYHYDILPDQVDGIYPTTERNKFYFFGYDTANNQIINARVEQHTWLRLKGVDHNSYSLMALPGMAIDNTYSQSVKTLMWMGVGRGRTNGSWCAVEPILVADTEGISYPNGNAFTFEATRLNSYTGVLKDLVTVPFKTWKPTNTITKEYRAGIGVQVCGGKLQFSDATAYDDTVNRNYTSTIETDSSLKILVLYKLSTQSQAEGILALDSSIEKAGMTLTEDTQVTHTSWSVKNNVVTEPDHGLEFMVTNLDSTPIKVYETFEKRVTGYPNESRWVQEFQDKSAIWCSSVNGITSSVFSGTYTIHDSTYALQSSAEGLRICYGRFYNGEARPVQGLTNRVGAACTLVGSTTVCIQESQSSQSLDCWQLVQTSLVVPFGCPRTWKAKQVKIDWNRWTGTATGSSKIFVWIARDQFLTQHPDYLGRKEISTGGTVRGCELVGQIDLSIGSKYQLFNIHDLESNVATLIITAFIDMDDINPSSGVTLPRGVGQIALNMQTLELTGTNTCFLPDIYLLG